MNDLLYGISTIIICGIGYYFSWRFQVKGNYTTAVFLVILCGLFLRFYGSSDLFLHEWDERYHALIAKNMVHHPLTPTLYDHPVLDYNYKDWTSNHIWLHKQPLPFWTMAVSIWFFGANEIAIRLPSILFTTIGIWLSFMIGRYFFNSSIGLLSAFFYSINGLILELVAGRSPTDHVDIFFLFFTQLSIYFICLYVQKQKTIYTILTGLSLGAAILCKWLPALIILPVWLLMITNSGKLRIREVIFQFILLFAVCLVTFLPWQFYIYDQYPDEYAWETSFSYRHLTEVIENHSGSWLYYLKIIRINFGDLVYLPLVWFVWKSIKNLNDKNRLAIAIWFLIPFLFFTSVKTKMPGYLLFTSPALFMMTAEFYFILAEKRETDHWKWLATSMMILLIAFPVRYMIERLKPFENSIRNPAWAIDLRKLNDKNIPNGILFNYKQPIEAMFYTNLTAYPNLPDTNELHKLLTKGYRLIINDNGRIPDHIKKINGIMLETLHDR